MSITDIGSASLDILATILSDEAFRPSEPDTLAETGLPVSLIEALICKRLLLAGHRSGRQLAEEICLPFQLIETLYQNLRFFYLIH